MFITYLIDNDEPLQCNPLLPLHFLKKGNKISNKCVYYISQLIMMNHHIHPPKAKCIQEWTPAPLKKNSECIHSSLNKSPQKFTHRYERHSSCNVIHWYAKVCIHSLSKFSEKIHSLQRKAKTPCILYKTSSNVVTEQHETPILFKKGYSRYPCILYQNFSKVATQSNHRFRSLEVFPFADFFALEPSEKYWLRYLATRWSSLSWISTFEFFLFLLALDWLPEYDSFVFWKNKHVQRYV